MVGGQLEDGCDRGTLNRRIVEGRSYQGDSGGYVVTEDSVNRLWLRVSRGQEGRLRQGDSGGQTMVGDSAGLLEARGEWRTESDRVAVNSRF